MDVAKIITGLGGPSAVGAVLGVSPNGVTQWGVRNRIPPRYWSPLLKMPNARRLGITMTALIEHAQENA